jgi:glycosidase
VQWDGGENAGFSTAKPWLGINANYRYINYASQKNDPASVLNFYKTLITLRKNSEALKFGKFLPVYANRHLMVYQRLITGTKLGEELYTVALNFSSRERKLPKKLVGLLSGSIFLSNTGRTLMEGKLMPWEGIILKGSEPRS